MIKLGYAPNSPLLSELRKPPIMYVAQQNYGVKKIKLRLNDKPKHFKR
jgi:hypothetical protein